MPHHICGVLWLPAYVMRKDHFGLYAPPKYRPPRRDALRMQLYSHSFPSTWNQLEQFCSDVTRNPCCREHPPRQYPPQHKMSLVPFCRAGKEGLVWSCREYGACLAETPKLLGGFGSFLDSSTRPATYLPSGLDQNSRKECCTLDARRCSKAAPSPCYPYVRVCRRPSST
ncbi:hypothetical protein LZ30DRAFT_735418 [Colletotrichum cereale]|nr:hypothetical protein LZ30DRAFT_735418 [Colletotrichum cereale]